MIHIHLWERWYDLEYDKFNYKIKRLYRHCHICDRWQKEIGGWYECEWGDSFLPEGVNQLIIEGVAKNIIKDIIMRQNSMKVE
jgi:hypothetical protein